VSDLADRELASLRGFYRAIATGEPRSHIVELGDVQVCVAPASRVASAPNGVVYGDADALLAALPELPELYGGLPFLVWIRPGHAEVVRAVEDAGLKRDGGPLIMAAPLEEIERPRRPGLDVRPVDWPVVCVVNERSYGIPPGAWGEVLGGIDDPAMRLYGVFDDGHPVAVAGARDEGGDLGIYVVATLPEARRRGLAAELIRVAAAEARERGLETTSLEASAMGEGVYAALGYRRMGALQTWERRV